MSDEMFVLPNPGDEEPDFDNVRFFDPVEIRRVTLNGFDTGIEWMPSTYPDHDGIALGIANCFWEFASIDDAMQAVRLATKAIALERGYAMWPRHPKDHKPPENLPFGGSFRELGGQR